MSDINTSVFTEEWHTLQNQFDSYEKFSLLIKLANIGLVSTAYLLNSTSLFVIILSLVLWLQDAIWKTFQSRIETRLLFIEGLLQSGANADTTYSKPCQFNSQYQSDRPGNAGLIKAYLCQALRPTIAFPHVVLVLLLAATWLF